MDKIYIKLEDNKIIIKNKKSYCGFSFDSRTELKYIIKAIEEGINLLIDKRYPHKNN